MSWRAIRPGPEMLPVGLQEHRRGSRPGRRQRRGSAYKLRQKTAARIWGNPDICLEIMLATCMDGKSAKAIIMLQAIIYPAWPAIASAVNWQPGQFRTNR